MISKFNLETLDISQISNIKEFLINSQVKTLIVSYNILNSLAQQRDLINLEIILSGEGDFNLLGEIILNNTHLRTLKLVKDNSLGMYTTEISSFDPRDYPHIDISIISNEQGRFI